MATTARLTQLRQDIKTYLADNTSLQDDQIIIERHQNPWDVISGVVSLANNGICLHISESSGNNSNTTQKGNTSFDVDLIFTLISNYKLPESLENEEQIFEEIVIKMSSFVTKLMAGSSHCLATGTLLGWSSIPNAFDYYTRAFTYRFTVNFRA